MAESNVSSFGTRDGQGLVEPKSPEMTLGELFSQLSSDLSTLFRKEVQLAKIEAKEEVSKVGKASASMAGAAVGGLIALMMLSFALAWWIDQALNTAVSFLIVG
ncbi:MAG TPA: phage holin family protein, partial [Ilumatobacteraceae bacterium]